MPTKSYTLADNATVTVNTTDNGVEFNAGMDAITKAVNSKLNSLNPIYVEATSLESGLMSATDKAKLDAIDTSKFVTVVAGKGLSTEDFTTAEKNKLESLTGDTTYDFDKKVTLESGFTTASSISSNFGVYNTINIKDNSTVKAENCYVNLSSGELVLTGSEIRANNANIAGIPTFTSGFKTADSVNSSFGDDNHVNLGHRSKLNLASDSTIDADHSYIDLGHGEIRFNYSKLTFSSSGNESITGNPIFTGTPTFLHGASGLSVGGGISYSDATTTTSGLMSKEDKAKLDEFKSASQYVTVVAGKRLSTEDFTTEEKQKLATLTGGADIDTSQFATKTELQTAIDNATIDTSPFATKTELQTAIDNVTIDTSQFATKTELQTAINNVTVDTSKYVLKDGNKVLSTNDYTNADKAKLDAISVSSGEIAIDTSKFATKTELQTAIDNVTIDTSPFATKTELQTAISNVTVDTSQFVLKEDGKGLSTKDYTAAEKNKLASLTISPTFTGIPRFEKGLKLGSGSDALKSMTINDGKLQIAIGSKTYTFTPDSSASTQNNLLTPTITFNPAQMDTIKGVKPYSFSYTINSDATYHSYYLTDSRYPNWRYPDDHDIIFSNDYALSNTINDVTILEPEASTDSGTMTYHITVPATDNYSEKTFTYSINYTNC